MENKYSILKQEIKEKFIKNKNSPYLYILIFIIIILIASFPFYFLLFLFFSLIILFFINIFSFKIVDKILYKIEKDKEFLEKTKKLETPENIKNEIIQKWFFILKTPNILKSLFFKELKEKTKNNRKRNFIFIYFSIFFIILIFQLFLLNWFSIEKFIKIIFITIIFSFVFTIILWNFLNNLIYKNSINYNWVKNDFIFFTEKNIFLDDKILEINEENFKKFTNLKKYVILEFSEILILKIFKTKQEKKFSKLTNLFLNLQKNSDEIIILLKNLINIFENFENWKFENSKINSLFKNLEKNLQKIFIQKENILIFLKNNNLEEKINLEKYNLWLKNHIILPLILLKENLEKNLQKTEKEFENSKNSENPQIILANKRLEIQKNSLKNQILLIDEKIKKLEI